MNFVKEYYDKIVSGEIIVNKRINKIYTRLASEMKEHPLFYFDEVAGERPIQQRKYLLKQQLKRCCYFGYIKQLKKRILITGMLRSGLS